MRAKDYDGVDRLMQQLHQLHVDARPDVYEAMAHPYAKEKFMQEIGGSDKIMLVAEEDNQVLGACVMTMKDKSGMVNMRTAYLEDLVVDEEHRNQGYGKALFDAAESVARVWGAERLDLMVWAFNDSAREFYEHMGMSTQRMIYEKKL
jgi:ribosomal protein S18 acetylase RimI-like enzyme